MADFTATRVRGGAESFSAAAARKLLHLALAAYGVDLGVRDVPAPGEQTGTKLARRGTEIWAKWAAAMNATAAAGLIEGSHEVCPGDPGKWSNTTERSQAVTKETRTVWLAGLADLARAMGIEPRDLIATIKALDERIKSDCESRGVPWDSDPVRLVIQHPSLPAEIPLSRRVVRLYLAACVAVENIPTDDGRWAAISRVARSPATALHNLAEARKPGLIDSPHHLAVALQRTPADPGPFLPVRQDASGKLADRQDARTLALRLSMASTRVALSIEGRATAGKSSFGALLARNWLETQPLGRILYLDATTIRACGGPAELVAATDLSGVLCIVDLSHGSSSDAFLDLHEVLHEKAQRLVVLRRPSEPEDLSDRARQVRARLDEWARVADDRLLAENKPLPRTGRATLPGPTAGELHQIVLQMAQHFGMKISDAALHLVVGILGPRSLTLASVEGRPLAPDPGLGFLRAFFTVMNEGRPTNSTDSWEPTLESCLQLLHEIPVVMSRDAVDPEARVTEVYERIMSEHSVHVRQFLSACAAVQAAAPVWPLGDLWFESTLHAIGRTVGHPPWNDQTEWEREMRRLHLLFDPGIVQDDRDRSRLLRLGYRPESLAALSSAGQSSIPAVLRELEHGSKGETPANCFDAGLLRLGTAHTPEEFSQAVVKLVRSEMDPSLALGPSVSTLHAEHTLVRVGLKMASGPLAVWCMQHSDKMAGMLQALDLVKKDAPDPFLKTLGRIWSDAGILRMNFEGPIAEDGPPHHFTNMLAIAGLHDPKLVVDQRASRRYWQNVYAILLTRLAREATKPDPNEANWLVKNGPAHETLGPGEADGFWIQVFSICIAHVATGPKPRHANRWEILSWLLAAIDAHPWHERRAVDANLFGYALGELASTGASEENKLAGTQLVLLGAKAAAIKQHGNPGGYWARIWGTALAMILARLDGTRSTAFMQGLSWLTEFISRAETTEDTYGGLVGRYWAALFGESFAALLAQGIDQKWRDETLVGLLLAEADAYFDRDPVCTDSFYADMFSHAAGTLCSESQFESYFASITGAAELTEAKGSDSRVIFWLTFFAMSLAKIGTLDNLEGLDGLLRTVVRSAEKKRQGLQADYYAFWRQVLGSFVAFVVSSSVRSGSGDSRHADALRRVAILARDEVLGTMSPDGTREPTSFAWLALVSSSAAEAYLNSKPSAVEGARMVLNITAAWHGALEEACATEENISQLVAHMSLWQLIGEMSKTASNEPLLLELGSQLMDYAESQGILEGETGTALLNLAVCALERDDTGILGRMATMVWRRLDGDLRRPILDVVRNRFVEPKFTVIQRQAAEKFLLKTLDALALR